MSFRIPASWTRVAFAMFSVGWGANQFSSMLVVYRHALGLGAGVIAGLFAIYAVALVPGLLVGGPASDRFGRRAVVLPFVALSPLATLVLVLGAHSLPAIAAGRALGGLCSGTVFGAGTAWVQDLSGGDSGSARRTALALSLGFGSGPVAAALLAQWAPDPLTYPYLPHLVIGVAAALMLWRVPGGAVRPGSAPVPGSESRASRESRAFAVPAAVRTRRFWLAVAPAAPVVFGSISVALVVLPEETGLSPLATGAATVLAFAGGIGVQSFGRRLEERWPGGGVVAGLACAAAGAAAGAGAIVTGSRLLTGAAALFLGLSYGLCLVSGLRQSEELAGARDRGAVLSCYYVLAYLGFAAPYVADAVNGALGDAGTLIAAACCATALSAWLAAQAGAGRRRPAPPLPARTDHRVSPR
jgi:Major Facilitator Superfamily